MQIDSERFSRCHW